MEANKLVIIMQSVMSGEVGIDLVWQQYRKELEEPTVATTYDEMMSLIAIHYQYATYLYNEGYTADALVYDNRALDILRQFEGKLEPVSYHKFLETILKHKAIVCNSLSNYKEGYKTLKELCEIEPRKDEYRIAKNNCFFGMVNKAIAPIYVIIIIIWAILTLQKWVLHVTILPSVLWEIGFWVWMVLLVIQFVVPFVAKHIRK